MSVSRRGFLLAVPAAGAALVFVASRRSPQSPGGSEAEPEVESEAGAEAPSTRSARVAPVVSFHLDQPYLDLTGLEKPYVPPSGMCAGAPLASLSEEEVLSRFYGFI